MAWIVYWLVLSSTFLAAVFAIWKGDKALRLGGILRLSIVLVTIPAQYLIFWFAKGYGLTSSYYDLAVSFITALCFLVLAFRFSNLWLGTAMMIQGGELYVASLYLDGAVRRSSDYTIWENLTTTGIAACLFFGTLAAIRGRAKGEAAATGAAQPA